MGDARPPRVFVEGGIYHVYNRVTRDERVFDGDGEAARLLDAMCDARDRDGLTVLAWCIPGNHDHMAVRCGSVPVWRTMASIHTRVSKSYNARYRVCGPFRQGRYREKPVDAPEYVRRLILPIHLNPVTTGIVDGQGESARSVTAPSGCEGSPPPGRESTGIPGPKPRADAPSRSNVRRHRAPPRGVRDHPLAA